MSEFPGRPLVPFFGDEKEIKMTPKQRKQKKIKSTVKVRSFGEDGYFTEAKQVEIDFEPRPLVPFQMDLLDEDTKTPPSKSSSSRKKFQKKKNKKEQKNKSEDENKFFAAPKFLQAPDPSTFPLPAFLEKLKRNPLIVKPEPKSVKVAVSAPFTPIKPFEIVSSKSTSFTPLKPIDLSKPTNNGTTVDSDELTSKLRSMLSLK